MSRVLRVKLFQAVQGDPANPLAAAEATEPLDRQINAWLERTGHELAGITAPAIQREFADPGQTRVRTTVAAFVTYRANPYAVAGTS
jgi:hypothetical protein